MNGRDFLLDTHAAIWWMEGSPKLPAACYRAVRRRGFAYVSLASAWEVAIETSLGRLRRAAPFGATLEASGFALLPLRLQHVEEIAALPLHHRDPFDRMLVAQARVENLTLVTGDRRLAAYDVPKVLDLSAIKLLSRCRRPERRLLTPRAAGCARPGPGRRGGCDCGASRRATAPR